MSNKILVAVDGSAPARKALQFAITIANALNSELNLLLVVVLEKWPTILLKGIGIPIEPTVIEEIKDEATQHVKKMFEPTLQEAKVNYKLIVEVGDNPGDIIIETAESLNVDHIVVGSRGLGTLKRIYVGSVSQYVLNHAHCTVTIAK